MEVLTLREAAEELGVDRDTVRRWVRDGRLPTYYDAHDRRRRLVLRSDLSAALAPKLGDRVAVEERRAYAH